MENFLIETILRLAEENISLEEKNKELKKSFDEMNMYYTNDYSRDKYYDEISCQIG